MGFFYAKKHKIILTIILLIQFKIIILMNIIVFKKSYYKMHSYHKK